MNGLTLKYQNVGQWYLSELNISITICRLIMKLQLPTLNHKAADNVYLQYYLAVQCVTQTTADIDNVAK